jgi:hypothetical protein
MACYVPPEIIKERNRKCYLKNKEEFNEISNKYYVESRDKLYVSYINRMLSKVMPKEAITPELIEVKRMQIKLLRLIKELR